MSSSPNPLEGFKKICSVKDLMENSGKRFIVNDVEIAVFLVNKNVYALSNICPHKQTALIYDGFIENGFVTCPAHGWTFNLLTGKTATGSNGLNAYKTIIVEDHVFVKVEEKNYSW